MPAAAPSAPVLPLSSIEETSILGVMHGVLLWADECRDPAGGWGRCAYCAGEAPSKGANAVRCAQVLDVALASYYGGDRSTAAVESFITA